MRSMVGEIGVLALAIMLAAVALAPNYRTNRKGLMVATILSILLITAVQYYLLAHTGRGLAERAACVAFPHGEFCNEKAADQTGKGAPQEYRSAPPPRMGRNDRWGRFNIDQNCQLSFGNAYIADLELEPGESVRCHYSPSFSPTPSGNKVLVTAPVNDNGPAVLALVDTRSGNVERSAAKFEEHEVSKPLDVWSSEESLTLVDTIVIAGPYIPTALGLEAQIVGSQPCVFRIDRHDLRCEDTGLFLSKVIEEMRRLSPVSECLTKKSCRLSLKSDNGRWDRGENMFEARLRASLFDESETPNLVRANVKVRLSRDGRLDAMKAEMN